MAALDFPASPATNQIFVGGNGVSYKWNGTMWVSSGGSGASITVGATPPGAPPDGSLWYNSDGSIGGGAMYIRYNDGVGAAQWVPASPAATPGSLLQTVFTETGTVATGTTVIPGDDTIPQITEGTEFMTCAITRMSATSKLCIEITAIVAFSVAAGTVTAALFQDATANALAAVVMTQATVNGLTTLTFKHLMTSGTTGATTFRVRIGPASAGTVTLNGNAGARLMGGVMASSIVIQEVA